jgi:dUTPase
MGSLILKASRKQPIDVNQLSASERSDLVIEPGEVMFVLTEEYLDLPKNMKALLSPKRKLSHDGIIILGGFCIDPLYKGKLLFGLYNFSSSQFPIQPGKKLIAALFYELFEDEINNFKKPETEFTTFPDELIRLMNRYRPISVQNVMEVVSQLQAKFDEMRKEFRDRDDWFKKFEKSLEDHDAHIKRILEMIEREVRGRTEAERDLERRIMEVYDKSNKNIQEYAKDAYKTAAVTGTLGALVISLIVYLIQTLIGK